MRENKSEPELESKGGTAEERAYEKFYDTYHIPESKLDAIVAHISSLRDKFPSMKNDRLLRKTAEYFKLKRKEHA